MSADPEVIPTAVILPNGERVAAEFFVWETDDGYHFKIRVELRFAGRRISAEAGYYLSALNAIRQELDRENLLINCYGASRNAFISGMSMDMSLGLKAYRVELGKDATIDTLVSIFESGSDVDPVTIAEQKAFFNQWTKSIRR